ncbi:hypothetical protein KJY73_04445 [Bowmanella sp. Y26]|uniref:hypothetical protein n=1 Tax=Bowmanella yangjiangensis TaxID=2811230 RepID=UPI001BDBB64C|nr:hypothetical protein [Bowmanella yangjiangensis]MBT1062810.1 hypothetical protein [Bowmanella yangjiangensis]
MSACKILNFLILAFICQMSWAKPADSIVVATALWSPHFVNDQENGIYQLLLSEVYPGKHIRYIYTSYARSKHLVSTGRADLWLGSYEQEESWALYPHHAHDADLVAAIHLKDTPWEGSSSLSQQTVSWISDYGFEKYLAKWQMTFYEASDLDIALKLLHGKRVRYVLDDIWEINTYLNEHPAMRNELQVTPFAIIKIYPAFKDNEKGRGLANQWDKAMQRLSQGKLQAIFAEKDEEFLLDACNHPAATPQQYECLEAPGVP